MILFISKIVIFGFEVVWYRPIATFGTLVLSVFDGYPRLELIVVMVIIPVTFNSMLYWVTDFFLKGDKHIENRKSKQEKEELERLRLLEEKRKKEEELAKRKAFDDNYE